MEQQVRNVAEPPASEILAQIAALTALVQAQGEEIARLKATSAGAPAVQARPATTSRRRNWGGGAGCARWPVPRRRRPF